MQEGRAARLSPSGNALGPTRVKAIGSKAARVALRVAGGLGKGLIPASRAGHLPVCGGANEAIGGALGNAATGIGARQRLGAKGIVPGIGVCCTVSAGQGGQGTSEVPWAVKTRLANCRDIPGGVCRARAPAAPAGSAVAGQAAALGALRAWGAHKVAGRVCAQGTKTTLWAWAATPCIAQLRGVAEAPSGALGLHKAPAAVKGAVVPNSTRHCSGGGRDGVGSGGGG